MAARPSPLVVSLVASPLDHVRARGLTTWLARVAPRAARGAVTIAVVSDRRIRQLNRQFRGVDAATDVLSFPAAATASPESSSAAATAPRRRRDTHPASSHELGDIAIARGVATRQARAAGHTIATELRVLALHGLLHLLGYDHETDDGAMARVESRLRRKGGLPDGLIERARMR